MKRIDDFEDDEDETEIEQEGAGSSRKRTATDHLAEVGHCDEIHAAEWYFMVCCRIVASIYMSSHNNNNFLVGRVLCRRRRMIGCRLGLRNHNTSRSDETAARGLVRYHISELFAMVERCCFRWGFWSEL